MPKPPTRGIVTSAFGMRTHPITGVYRMHYGEDTIGDGNYAPATGTVIFAGYDTSGMGFGNAVAIREDARPDHIWWTAHHATLGVAVGAHVVENVTRTGPTGKTGAASGVHAHQECRVGGNARPGSGVAINPRAQYQGGAGGGGTPTGGDPDMAQVCSVSLPDGNQYAYRPGYVYCAAPTSPRDYKIRTFLRGLNASDDVALFGVPSYEDMAEILAQHAGMPKDCIMAPGDEWTAEGGLNGTGKHATAGQSTLALSATDRTKIVAEMKAALQIPSLAQIAALDDVEHAQLKSAIAAAAAKIKPGATAADFVAVLGKAIANG